MHCPDCNYPLWNLPARTCPECGRPFRPSDFEFVPNTVRFCCPACNQPYYGTSATGHLEPAEFDCVTCGRRVAMDDMVLRPAEGVDEQQTKATSNPWLDRRELGFFKGWFKAIGGAMVGPSRVIAGTPEPSSLLQATWFLLLTIGLSVGVGMAVPMCVFGVMAVVAPPSGPGGGGGPALAAAMGAMTAFMVVAFVFAVLVVVLPLWTLGVQVLLGLTGTGHRSWRRTYQALCYSSGAMSLAAVPCLGNVATPWWLVSAVLMVKDGHRITGGRATFAVLTPPLVMGGLAALAYFGFIMMIITAAATAGPGGMAAGIGPTQGAATVASAVVDYAATHDGQGPPTALLLTADGSLEPYELISPLTATDTTHIIVTGHRSLFDVSLEPEEARQSLLREAVAAMPPDVVAHRVGDYVFTYHGMDLRSPVPGLWIVIFTPDPVVNPQAATFLPVYAVEADGTVTTIAAGDLAAALIRRNIMKQVVMILQHPFRMSR